MLYDSIAEYNQAIKETKAAISRIILAGQSRSIGTISSGGNRATTESDLQTLRNHLEFLQKEKQLFVAQLESGQSFGSGFRVVPGW